MALFVEAYVGHYSTESVNLSLRLVFFPVNIKACFLDYIFMYVGLSYLAKVFLVIKFLCHVVMSLVSPRMHDCYGYRCAEIRLS